MTAGEGDPAATAAWFGPEQADALADFWAVYEPNINLGAVLRETTEEPRLAEVANRTLGETDEKTARLRAMLRRAIAGDWAPYEATLRGLGAEYARNGFAGWQPLMTAFARRMIPILIQTYVATPPRLTAAMLVMSQFFDRVGKTLSDAYLETKESMARDSEARSAAIVRTAFDGIVSMDERGRITEWNPAAEQMFGSTRAEVLGRELAEVVVPHEQKQQLRADLARYLSTGESTFLGRRTEMSALRKDGTPVRLEVAALRVMTSGPPSFTAFVRDITAQRAADEVLRTTTEQLRLSEERHRVIFECTPVPMFVFDATTTAFLAVNEAAVELYGYSRDELLAMTLLQVKAEVDSPATWARDARWGGVRPHRRKDGAIVRLQITSRPITLDGRAGRLAVAIDVTAKEDLEAQLRQSQKMEAVGSLAGGVAHDFNNLLSVILSYSEMAAIDLAPEDALRDDLAQIREAGERAAALTRQLLAFSRRQLFQPKTVHLEAIVRGIETMLQRLIGEDVGLSTVTSAELHPISVDPGQIEQVIMNLAVNARDAMPRGGKITIETTEVTLREDEVLEDGSVRAGRHVVLTFRDEGVGMTEETKARIFEPFFTTKEIGKGTGLGLSTVFGIVRQSGGMIRVDSEVGVGTTFRVYFPAVDPETRPVSDHPPEPVRRSSVGIETILLVEDDPGVRSLAQTILSRAGYVVLEARNGGEAILHCEQYPSTIHLMLTDVVMPLASGREVAERLRPLRPEMRVLYMSGYTDDSIVRHGILDETIEFLAKPITPDALIAKVRHVLDMPLVR